MRTQSEDRKQRLAAALRQNLKRRKVAMRSLQGTAQKPPSAVKNPPRAAALEHPKDD